MLQRLCWRKSVVSPPACLPFVSNLGGRPHSLVARPISAASWIYVFNIFLVWQIAGTHSVLFTFWQLAGGGVSYWQLHTAINLAYSVLLFLWQLVGGGVSYWQLYTARGWAQSKLLHNQALNDKILYILQCLHYSLLILLSNFFFIHVL